MNKRIDYSFTGGFPLTQETLAWMQDSYRNAFGAIASLLGPKVILYGCVISGGTVSNGWVAINGELMPFVGSSYTPGDTVIVVETPTSKLFEDGNSHDVMFEKVARIGSGGGSFVFTDLKAASLFAVGMILMWSGAIGDIPAGWGLCDGGGGRPNLSGMFIAGYDSGDTDYSTIGNTGGEKKHTLSVNELPQHGHSINTTNSAASSNDTSDPVRGSTTGTVNTRGGAGSGRTVGVTGGNEAHENRPPYYVLAYIIKL